MAISAPLSPEVEMRLIADELIRIQASAADALQTTTTWETLTWNASWPGLTIFEPRDIVLF